MDPMDQDLEDQRTTSYLSRRIRQYISPSVYCSTFRVYKKRALRLSGSPLVHIPLEHSKRQTVGRDSCSSLVCRLVHNHWSLCDSSLWRSSTTGCLALCILRFPLQDPRSSLCPERRSYCAWGCETSSKWIGAGYCWVHESPLEYETATVYAISNYPQCNWLDTSDAGSPEG